MKCWVVIIFSIATFLFVSACIKYSVDGTMPSYLAVSDYANNRVLIFFQWPSTINQAADVVLGQPNFTSSTQNNGGVSATSIGSANGVCGTSTSLYVVDQYNSRVLGWRTFPKQNQQAADFVLGQVNFSQRLTNSGGLSSGLSQPQGCTVLNGALAVSDTANNRVLFWNIMPASSQVTPSFALGQPNLSSNTANNGGISASTLSNPAQASSDGTHLAVGDVMNNRVLIWNSIPTFSGQPADLVLGQPNFSSSTTNAGQGPGNPSANTLSLPAGTVIVGGKLIVADDGNNRVLIWNTFPRYNQQPADVVIGQPTMITDNQPPVTSQQIQYGAENVGTDGVRLFISETYDHRILIFNSIPTQNYQAADLVLGQPNFNTSLANEGGAASQQSLKYPGPVFSNALYFGTSTPWGY